MLEMGFCVAEVRVDLLDQFSERIDAGTLRVRHVDGRTVVEMATDSLFLTGSADLSTEGQAAIRHVGEVLAQIPDHHYQVKAHTDDVPDKGSQYPSNWELAAARSITLLGALTQAGLGPERVSAASFTFYKLAGQPPNRRVEIIIVPDLSDLPGFDR